VSGEQVARRPDRTPLMRRDPLALAGQFIASGLFGEMTLPQAVVKIVAGEELGIGPMASMTGVHIIKGKPALSANLLGVQVKRTERYNFRPVEVTAEKARIEWFEGGESAGFTEFTIEQAKTANLIKSDSGWEKYPEDMLFARALSRGIRRFCPEVTAGAPAYTPEELGADVDQDGEPVFVENEAEAEPSPDALLPNERVNHLEKGIELVEPALAELGPGADSHWIDGLNLILGSLGADRVDLRHFRTDLARLAPEEADALDAELQKLVDDAEEVNGEVVEETPDA
jgi:hypothetical protein